MYAPNFLLNYWSPGSNRYFITLSHWDTKNITKKTDGPPPSKLTIARVPDKLTQGLDSQEIEILLSSSLNPSGKVLTKSLMSSGRHRPRSSHCPVTMMRVSTYKVELAEFV